MDNKQKQLAWTSTIAKAKKKFQVSYSWMNLKFSIVIRTLMNYIFIHIIHQKQTI